jgi:monovalent cation:H+ antiporter-2, CPA2 family
MAAAFAAAWILGILAQKLRLSPIVGYLLAGVAIGPYTPGFHGDVKLASQLAEVGVVLLMFGVGLHFHLSDLLAVKRIAIPGALIQCSVATGLGLALGLAMGWPPSKGLVLGMALSVASTVVLLRGLEAHDLVSTPSGHVAIGWLIVEDILTVVVLVVIPALAPSAASGSLVQSMAIALLKLSALVVVVLVVGARVLPRVLTLVARLRSRELFTLTILAIAIAVATLASVVFGASMALGAFLAGMVVSQSPVSAQAAADALPMRDAFSVLFFVSVGMLLDPGFFVREPLLFLAGLGIVLLGKPLAALVVTVGLGYSTRTALVVALGLAQIGEFSFILGDLARQHDLIGETGGSLLVAIALVSISLNPFLFDWLDDIERWLRARPRLWAVLDARAAQRRGMINSDTAAALAAATGPRAVIIGYGPVGQAVDRVLSETGIDTVVVDLNMDTIAVREAAGRRALYGDASQPGILEQAGIARAEYLIVTLPHSVNRTPLITTARQLSPRCRIFVRARYLREGPELVQAGASAAVFEEAEAAVALTSRVLSDLGRSESEIAREAGRVRQETAGLVDFA